MLAFCWPARRSVGVFTSSSAEYCPTFATTISGGGGDEDGSGMTGSSYSSCPSFWGVVSFTTCGVSCGVASGACCGVSAVASVLADFAKENLGGFFLGLSHFLFLPAAPEVDGVTAGVVSLDLGGLTDVVGILCISSCRRCGGGRGSRHFLWELLHFHRLDVTQGSNSRL